MYNKTENYNQILIKLDLIIKRPVYLAVLTTLFYMQFHANYRPSPWLIVVMKIK